MEIRHALVFPSTTKAEALRIVSGEIKVIVPFKYDISRGTRIFLFFPSLLPCPELFGATVYNVATGSPVDLQNRAVRSNADCYVLLDETNKNKFSMILSWDADRVLMSQDEIVNKAYAAGELPEIPE